MSLNHKAAKLATKHILDAVDSIGFESEDYYSKCTTEKAKAKFIHARFQSEYGWRVQQVGFQKAIIDWLQGLALPIAFYNHDILENYKLWNDKDNLTEKEEDKILSQYWAYMAMRLISLWRKHKIIN